MIIRVVLLCLTLEVISSQLVPVIKDPRPLYRNVDMPIITASDIDKAFCSVAAVTKRRHEIENQILSKGAIIERDSRSPEATHQKSTAASQIGPKNPADYAEKFETATAYLIKKFNLTSEQVAFGLPYLKLNESIEGSKELEECLNSDIILDKTFTMHPRVGEKEITCDEKPTSDYFRSWVQIDFGDLKSAKESKFRVIDGHCNNLINANLGRSKQDLARLLAPKYDDLVSAPRKSVNGADLPSARLISSSFLKEVDVPSRQFTHMLMQFGQFTDHDITSSPTSTFDSVQILVDCCKADSVHPNCLPIDIAANDPFHRKFGKTCMNFVRSLPAVDCVLGPRQHINLRTAALDASNVYGAQFATGDVNKDAGYLRDMPKDGLGELKRSRFAPNDSLLPEVTPLMGPTPPVCNIPIEETWREDKHCFSAGDDRVNEQPGLTSMHTLWFRQHNRIVRNLLKANPSFYQDTGAFTSEDYEAQKALQTEDRIVYEESRRIVAAQLQYITYKEFLPIVIGETYMKHFNLNPLKDGYTKYDPSKQLQIFQEFSTSAFRFGHTLVQNSFKKFDTRGFASSFNLKERFFDPRELYKGDLSSILTGLFKQPAQQYDNHIADDLVNHLYEEKGGKSGLDLPAINIQRGRDHGISSYTDYLEYCFDLKITKFDDLNKVIRPDLVYSLSKIYESPLDIDLFVGGISETPLPNAVVGPTFGCIIGIQFNQLKFGDRYYFEHGGQSGSFTPAQLSEIRKKTSLAQVICANTNKTINSIQKRVMEMAGYNSNYLISCACLPDIDFSLFPLSR